MDRRHPEPGEQALARFQSVQIHCPLCLWIPLPRLAFWFIFVWTFQSSLSGALGKQWHPTPVLLPRKSHGQRSLVGFSPWGRYSQTRLSDFTFTFHFHALEKEMATHSSVLAWRIPGTVSLVGCRLWGRTESDTTEATQQQGSKGLVLVPRSWVQWRAVPPGGSQPRRAGEGGFPDPNCPAPLFV